MKGLLVVAHCDDEALWFGGLLSCTARKLDWTVLVCTTPVNDPARVLGFPLSCTALGAEPAFLGLEDEGPARALDPVGLKASLGPHVAGVHLVVTHGPAGEYGHPHHRQVHDAVRHQATGFGVMFAHSAYGSGALGALTFPLSERQWEQKLTALRAYGHRAPADHGKPKWQALLERYGDTFDLRVEPYIGLPEHLVPARLQGGAIHGPAHARG